MQYCFSTEVVDLDHQMPNRNKRESRYFWDELNHLIAAGGFHTIEVPYEVKWDFGGRSGIPRSLRSITTKFGTASAYMAYLKENGIDGIECVHFDPSLFCRGAMPMYFGAAAHFGEEAISFAAETSGRTLTMSVTPPYFAVRGLAGDDLDGFLSKTGELIGHLAAFAEEKQVTFCLKNEYWGLLRGEKITAFLDSFGGKVLLDVDTAHLSIAGTDTAKVLADNRGRIGVVHFTDTAFSDETETWKSALPEFPAGHATKVFTDPGEGRIDFRSILAALEADGYDGTVVINPRNSNDICRSILRAAWTLASF